MNIKKAQRYPKATEYVGDIEGMIKSLVEKGFAYEEGGSVYFRVSAFPRYGRLAHLNFDEMKDGAGGFGPNERRGTDDKESARDFALWKAFTEQDGEVAWDSAFGRGRPGWHIECSAMAHKLLGPTIDIHAGGVDLVFPHHENEIAQSEAFSGKTFCDCWIHNGFVNINNEKMSKSLKNFKTLRDIARTAVDARAFRFMVVTAQYRAPLNFNPDTLSSATNSLKRIDKVVTSLKASADVDSGSGSNNQLSEVVNLDIIDNLCSEVIAGFESAMCDDMNTPRAVACLFKLVSESEKAIKSSSITAPKATKLLNAFGKIDSVFGLFYDVPPAYFSTAAEAEMKSFAPLAPLSQDNIPLEVAELILSRKTFKNQKDFVKADDIRETLLSMGFVIKDIKGGDTEVYSVAMTIP